MLTSMILGILTIVLALAFSLLHLAAAFSAMKEKKLLSGKQVYHGGELSHLTSSCYLFLYPACNGHLMDSGL